MVVSKPSAGDTPRVTNTSHKGRLQIWSQAPAHQMKQASTCEPSQDVTRVFCVQMQVARSQVHSEHVKALGVPLVECHHDLHPAGGMLESAAGPQHSPEGQLGWSW